MTEPRDRARRHRLRLLSGLFLLATATRLCAQGPGAAPPAENFFPMPVTVPRAAPGPAAPAGAIEAVPPRLRLEVQEKGNSSRDELQAAIRRFPFSQLDPTDRERIRPVLESPTLFRRLPKIRCEIDPRGYTFFTAHPDVAVSIWRAMGISEMQLYQTGPREYETDLRDGTQGVITVLHSSSGRQVVLCEGQFKSPLLARPIQSTGLLALETAFTRDATGRTFVTHTADVFVLFPSNTVEAVARLISPMSFKMADRNFEEVTLFLRLMDEAMCRQPGWVEQTAGKLDGILPGRDAELLAVTAQVYAEAARRQAATQAADAGGGVMR